MGRAHETRLTPRRRRQIRDAQIVIRIDRWQCACGFTVAMPFPGWVLVLSRETFEGLYLALCVVGKQRMGHAYMILLTPNACR